MRRTLLVVLCGLASFGADPFPHRATVVRIEELTHDTKRVSFQIDNAKAFRFTPGQYVFLQVPGEYVTEWNERYKTTHQEVARPYSLASSSSRLPYFDLVIKWVQAPPDKDVPPGLASTYVHERLKVGDVVRFSKPLGNLYQRTDTGRPVLIVAGSTGAAPFLSLLEHWFENRFEERNEIYFFFGARARADLFLHAQFQEWARTKKGFHYIPALSGPTREDNWAGETGYIHTVIEKHTAGIQDADAYLAGPPIMVREAIKVLNAKGIPGERIHHDPIDVR